MGENNFINIKNLYININDISLIEKVLNIKDEIVGLRVFIKGINKYINLSVSDIPEELASINIIDEFAKLAAKDKTKTDPVDPSTPVPGVDGPMV